METPKSYKKLCAELEHSTNLVILNYAIERLAKNKEENMKPTVGLRCRHSCVKNLQNL